MTSAAPIQVQRDHLSRSGAQLVEQGSALVRGLQKNICRPDRGFAPVFINQVDEALAMCATEPLAFAQEDMGKDFRRVGDVARQIGDELNITVPDTHCWCAINLDEGACAQTPVWKVPFSSDKIDVRHLDDAQRQYTTPCRCGTVSAVVNNCFSYPFAAFCAPELPAPNMPYTVMKASKNTAEVAFFHHTFVLQNSPVALLLPLPPARGVSSCPDRIVKACQPRGARYVDTRKGQQGRTFFKRDASIVFLRFNQLILPVIRQINNLRAFAHMGISSLSAATLRRGQYPSRPRRSFFFSITSCIATIRGAGKSRFLSSCRGFPIFQNPAHLKGQSQFVDTAFLRVQGLFQFALNTFVHKCLSLVSPSRLHGRPSMGSI